MAPMPKPTEPESPWRAQELLLMREIVRLIGRSLAPEVVLREMLHLMSELLGLNRGRIVLAEPGSTPGRHDAAPARIRYAYGLTRSEIERGVYATGEGITGRVLAAGQPMVVQDIDAEPLFLARAVPRAQLPPETVAFLALPIEVGHRTVGVLACHRIRSRLRHLNDDLALLGILSTLAGQVLQLQELMQEKTRALEARNALLTHALDSAAARYGIVGSSTALLRALNELERVSQSQASVLLLGESGTGKELFARALHLASQRRDAPFIKVNCAAIPEALMESELFGHEKGAFTGAAAARAGWFEQADGGSIFLDEIGDMPLAMQTKLLRTLQEGTVVRLGGTREIQVDVRLVAATHRDLAVAAQHGGFRQDLFYRLNVIPIRLPALRERPEDIRLLALHFVNRANQTHQRNVHLTPSALDLLQQQDWPGNIRELSNVIERLVLLTDSAHVSTAELRRFLPALPSLAALPAPPYPSARATRATIGPLVRDYLPAHSHTAEQLEHALALQGGNQSRAAQALGLTVRQFGYRLRKARR
jgi:Nif-specific regulatory protein